jgi:hypothetical protein
MPRPPCVCHFLHSNCDPKYCYEAALTEYDDAVSTGSDETLSTGSDSRHSNKRMFSPGVLLKNVKKGCLTCEVLYLSIASLIKYKKKDDIELEATKKE